MLKPLSVFQLYRESWRIYLSNFKKALLHLSLPILFLLSSTTSLYFLDETNFRYSILFSILSFIFYLISLFLFPLSFLSFLHSLPQNIPFKQSILISLKKLPRFLLLSFILISILLGSLILGFIPFILASAGSPSHFSLSLKATVFWIHSSSANTSLKEDSGEPSSTSPPSFSPSSQSE